MIGNDDCGQMSAWYILSTLGFYPVNPTNGEFVIGAPQIKNAKIQLSNGKVFSIHSDDFSKNTLYQNECLLNAIPLQKPIITYSEIMNGGTLRFKMSKN
jgi:putative alpha-1,2-mannosidase